MVRTQILEEVKILSIRFLVWLNRLLEGSGVRTNRPDFLGVKEMQLYKLAMK